MGYTFITRNSSTRSDLGNFISAVGIKYSAQVCAHLEERIFLVKRSRYHTKVIYIHTHGRAFIVDKVYRVPSKNYLRSAKEILYSCRGENN